MTEMDKLNSLQKKKKNLDKQIKRERERIEQEREFDRMMRAGVYIKKSEMARFRKKKDGIRVIMPEAITSEQDLDDLMKISISVSKLTKAEKEALSSQKKAKDEGQPVSPERVEDIKPEATGDNGQELEAVEGDNLLMSGTSD